MFHKQGIKPFAIDPFQPSIMVSVGFKTIGSGCFQLIPKPQIQLLNKPIQAPLVNGVLQPGVSSINTVSIISLDGDYCFGNFNNSISRHKTNYISQSGVSVNLAKGTAQSTAYTYIKTHQLIVYFYGNKAQVIGKNINIVFWGYGKSNFKFSGQIGCVV